MEDVMKKVWFGILMLFMFACSAQKEYSIEGTIEAVKPIDDYTPPVNGDGGNVTYHCMGIWFRQEIGSWRACYSGSAPKFKQGQNVKIRYWLLLNPKNGVQTPILIR